MNPGKTRASLIYASLVYAEMDWLLAIRLIAAIIALAFFLLNIIIARETIGYTPWVFLLLALRQIITLLIRYHLLIGPVAQITRDSAVTLSELLILVAAIRFWLLMRKK